MKQFCFLILVVLLAACSSNQPLMLPTTQNDLVGEQSYRLMAGDDIDLNVAQRQDISGDYKLDPTGSIHLPGIGMISLNNLTQDEAEIAVLDSLKRYYSPVSLTLRIKSYRSNEFFVILGAVEQPGVYPLKNQVSLLKAIGMAQGFSQAANRSQVQLIRNKSEYNVLSVNFDRIIKTGRYDQDYILENDDLIFVPAKPMRVVFDYLSEYLPLIEFSLLMMATYYQLK